MTIRTTRTTPTTPKTPLLAPPPPPSTIKHIDDSIANKWRDRWDGRDETEQDGRTHGQSDRWTEVCVWEGGGKRGGECQGRKN